MVQVPQTLGVTNKTQATASPTSSTEETATPLVFNETTNSVSALVVNGTGNATATSVTS